MNKSNLDSKLKEIIATIFEVEATTINGKFDAKSTDKWDSMNHMNLIVSIEEEFDLEIDEDEILELMSYQALADYLNKALN